MRPVARPPCMDFPPRRRGAWICAHLAPLHQFNRIRYETISRSASPSCCSPRPLPSLASSSPSPLPRPCGLPARSSSRGWFDRRLPRPCQLSRPICCPSPRPPSPPRVTRATSIARPGCYPSLALAAPPPLLPSLAPSPVYSVFPPCPPCHSVLSAPPLAAADYPRDLRRAAGSSTASVVACANMTRMSYCVPRWPLDCWLTPFLGHPSTAEPLALAARQTTKGAVYPWRPIRALTSGAH